jgi:hypothetical protein
MGFSLCLVVEPARVVTVFAPRLGLPTPIPDTRKETLSAPLLILQCKIRGDGEAYYC